MLESDLLDPDFVEGGAHRIRMKQLELAAKNMREEKELSKQMAKEHRALKASENAGPMAKKPKK